MNITQISFAAVTLAGAALLAGCAVRFLEQGWG